MLNHKLQVINFLLIPLLLIAATFSATSYPQYLLILGLFYLNLIILLKEINYRSLLLFSLSLLPAIMAMFISSYLFAAAQLMQSISLSLRLFSLGIISFGFSYHMPKQKLILSLLQWRILSVKIGFALLAAFNAFSYLGQEFRRIQLAYQMRYLRRSLSPKIILPLLIAAARYAHNLSISMYNRGLNQKRSYCEVQAAVGIYDYGYWLINLAVLFCILRMKF